jgi:pyridoxine 5-phosphate synthase
MAVLSVNLNKVAVLRNSRGGSIPSVARAGVVCLDAGCAGLTVHPRPDQRHIVVEDVRTLASLVAGRAELNIEGNPFAPARPGYRGFLKLCAELRPTQATLVPDSDDQLTSDHGFDLPRDGARLKPAIAELKAIGCRVSIFVDSRLTAVEQVAELGADRIEIFTGPYAHAFDRGDASEELARCATLARRARAVGLAVNAGHDLSQANLGAFIGAVAHVAEVSIGHALFADAIFAGLGATVQSYRSILGETKSRVGPK